MRVLSCMDIHGHKMNSMAAFAAACGRGLLRTWRPGWAPAMTMLVTLAQAPTAGAAAVVGGEVPDFALRTLEGQNLRLSEFRGEVVLVNFWATWCGACREQIASLQDLHAKYGKAGFVLLSVNLDDDTVRAIDMARRLKISYPVLMDERKEVAKQYQLENLPLTVLVDREGIVRQVYSNFKAGDEKVYLEQVRGLLKE
jgi:peroxiredoxin